MVKNKLAILYLIPHSLLRFSRRIKVVQNLLHNFSQFTPILRGIFNRDFNRSYFAYVPKVIKFDKKRINNSINCRDNIKLKLASASFSALPLIIHWQKSPLLKKASINSSIDCSFFPMFFIYFVGNSFIIVG